MAGYPKIINIGGADDLDPPPIQQGADWSALRVRLEDSDGDPVVTHGVKAQIRTGPGVEPVAEFTVTAEEGEWWRLSLTAAQTRDIPVLKRGYRYDIDMIDPDGVKLTPFIGSVLVFDEITV